MTGYHFRKSAFDKEKIYSLTNTGLNIEEVNNAHGIIPYTDISSIRLSYMPDRGRTNNYQCDIVSKLGKYSLSTYSYISLANFKEDGETYKQLVKELIQKVYAANPSVELLSGRPKSAYITSISFMAIAFIAVALLIYYLGDYMSSISWLKFVIILLMIPMAIGYINKNKPGRFTADSIP